MSDQPTCKPMVMLLQDQFLKDADGEYLHCNYPFPLDQDFLVGTGSSKFIVRDNLEQGASLDWGDPTVGLTYEDFKRRAGNSRSFINDPEFRQVNAFAVASHTLHTVERRLGRKIKWNRDGPLEIRTSSSTLGDGHWDSFSSSLRFGSLSSPSNLDDRAWISLSHELVSHEVGHAIWDSFRPLFAYSELIDTPALHESFADCVALFSKLEHDVLVKRLYENLVSRGEEDTVYSDNFFMTFLFVGPDSVFVRQHLNPETLTSQYYDPKEPQGAHERSGFWTAAICDILHELWKKLEPATRETRKRNSDDFAGSVVTAVDRTRLVLLRALHYVPLSGITMPLLARLFCKADERLSPEDHTIRSIAKEVFKKRNLWYPDIRLGSVTSNQWRAWVAEFEDENSDAAYRTKMVMEQAKALHIPLDKRPRVLPPRIARANGEIHLYIAYELVDTTDAPVYEPWPPTEQVRLNHTKEKERVRVPSYYGGTLVIDEKFEKPGILVIDPPAANDDAQEAAPAMHHARSAERRDVIASDLGFLLRHMEGYFKVPGFAGFDWPETDEQGGIAMTTSDQEPRGPEGLKPHPLVKKLVSDPSNPAVPTTVFEGLLGRSASDGYWRLYLTIELEEYLEIRQEDVLHHESIAKEHPPFVGLDSTRLWVKRNAETLHTRVGSPLQVQASFLAGDIGADLKEEADPTLGTLGAEAAAAAAGFPLVAATGSVWCPPTYRPGCGSLICRRRTRC